jgi:hypothetical protein
MEATCTSGTSVGFRQTTRRHIPEDGTLLTPPIARIVTPWNGSQFMKI